MTLTFDLELVRIIAHEVCNFLTSFGGSRTFRSRLVGQHLSNASRDLATLFFDLGGHGSCSVRRPSYSEDTTHFQRQLNRSGDLTF